MVALLNPGIMSMMGYVQIVVARAGTVVQAVPAARLGPTPRSLRAARQAAVAREAVAVEPQAHTAVAVEVPAALQPPAPTELRVVAVQPAFPVPGTGMVVLGALGLMVTALWFGLNNSGKWGLSL